MVTAILPSLTDETIPAAETTPKPLSFSARSSSVRLSMDSEATITPESFHGASYPEETWEEEDDDDEEEESPRDREDAGGKPSALAGFVGLFTGCGALVALSLFLPLPAQFSHIEGLTLADAVRYSFYVVGCVALLVGAFAFFGLRGLRGEEGKGLRMLFGLGSRSSSRHTPITPSSSSSSSFPAPKPAPLPYRHLLLRAIRLGLTDPDIAIGYLGGFVARASTVAISLFIPLSVNAYFFGHGFCRGSPTDPSPDLKRECRQAYVLASILTGVAQLVGLVCAPVFGYLSSRKGRGRTGSWWAVMNWPVVVSTVLGVVGYIGFSRLPSPELKDVDGRGGGPGVLLLAALIGASQIGAIVCSLGSLGRGVLKADDGSPLADEDRDSGLGSALDNEENHNQNGHENEYSRRESTESNSNGNHLANPSSETPLLLNGPNRRPPSGSRVALKGSVAGVYSWCGGAAILLLTKLGGYLFDAWSHAAPFYLMAAFNAVLLVASVGIDLGGRVVAAGSRRRRRNGREGMGRA
jgi:hypothetical protein